jgi:peptidyl-dipeptidase A
MRAGSAITATVIAGALLAAARPAGSQAPRRPRLTAAEKEAGRFLEDFTALARPVDRVAAEAAWRASAEVTPENSGVRAGAARAAGALAGAPAVIEKTRALLARDKQLGPLTVRQLHRLLRLAAEQPGTLPQVVSRRQELEAAQARITADFRFCLQSAAAAGPPDAAAPRCLRPATAGQVDQLLRTSTDLDDRARAWTASKEVGRPLKPGLESLVPVRNQLARELGFGSYFALQAAGHGLTVKELMALLDSTLTATAPIYDGLHCWARHQLAARFRQPPPRQLPAHWLANRWGQTWPGLVDTAPDRALAGHDARWLLQTAERFYVALGFPPLPEPFWQASDLFPLPAGTPRRKDLQASVFHIDGERDIRALMAVEPTERWFGTAHHELGHVYYDLAYARPEIPYLLRDGASRAFHEALGELARLASQQPPYRQRLGLSAPGPATDAAAGLLSAALDSIVFLTFAAGTVTHFEHDLYEAGLPATEWQPRWWQYAARFQGLAPPAARPPELCDACTKSQLHDAPARYYDYTLATLIQFQLHDHICRKILHQDVHACDYGSSKPVGDFLRGLMSVGATRDWRQLLKQATGEDIGPRALVDHFAPLRAELDRRNQGKDCRR